MRTSLEAGDWCGHFHTAAQKVGQSGKDGGKQQSYCSSSSKQKQLVGHDWSQCYRGIGAMTSIASHLWHRGALVNMDPCLAERANAGSSSAGGRRISNFFVPPKVRPEQHFSVLKLSSTHNGRTLQKEGYVYI